MNPPSRPARVTSRLSPIAAAMLLFAAACAGDDQQAQLDSTLARDLALANVVAQPQFNDVPIGEAPEQAATAPQGAPAAVTPAPSGGTAGRTTPQPTTPRPAARPRPAQREQPAPSRQREPVRSESPAPAPAPAPAPVERVGFGAGTRLALNTGARVCTVTGRVGDKIVATLNAPVHGTGGAMIPSGTTVVLEVASVQPGDPAESGRIAFRVRSLDIDARAHPAQGSGAVAGGLDRTQVAGSGGNDKKKVIGGAILGAIAGRVIEGSARGAVTGAAAGGAVGAISARGDQRFEGCLPAGAPVTITLDEAVTLG